jgi:hypothetical protein
MRWGGWPLHQLAHGFHGRRLPGFQQELQRGFPLGLRGTGRQVQESNILSVCPPGHVLAQLVVGEAESRRGKQFVAVAVGGVCP